MRGLHSLCKGIGEERAGSASTSFLSNGNLSIACVGAAAAGGGLFVIAVGGFVSAAFVLLVSAAGVIVCDGRGGGVGAGDDDVDVVDGAFAAAFATSGTLALFPDADLAAVLRSVMDTISATAFCMAACCCFSRSLAAACSCALPNTTHTHAHTHRTTPHHTHTIHTYAHDIVGCSRFQIAFPGGSFHHTAYND